MVKTFHAPPWKIVGEFPHAGAGPIQNPKKKGAPEIRNAPLKSSGLSACQLQPEVLPQFEHL